MKRFYLLVATIIAIVNFQIYAERPEEIDVDINCYHLDKSEKDFPEVEEYKKKNLGIFTTDGKYIFKIISNNYDEKNNIGLVGFLQDKKTNKISKFIVSSLKTDGYTKLKLDDDGYGCISGYSIKPNEEGPCSRYKEVYGSMVFSMDNKENKGSNKYFAQLKSDNASLYNSLQNLENSDYCYYGVCVFPVYERTISEVTWNGKKNYFFKVAIDGKTAWIFGSDIYLQKGIFDKIPVIGDASTDLLMKDLAGFYSVNTGDGSRLRVRDGPSTSDTKVVVCLDDKSAVYVESTYTNVITIDEKKGVWCKIIYPVTGYVFGEYLGESPYKGEFNILPVVGTYSLIQFKESSEEYTIPIHDLPMESSKVIQNYKVKCKKTRSGYSEPRNVYLIGKSKNKDTVNGVSDYWYFVQDYDINGFIFGDYLYAK